MGIRRYTRPLPFNYNDFGMYRIGATSGIIPATPLANHEVFQFRWNPSNRDILAIIKKIKVTAAVSTTYFAAGVPVQLSLTRASAWSGQGTLGSALTPAALHKLDSAMASTALATGDCRIAGTDANGLGAGTKTLEGEFIGNVLSGAPITGSLSGQIFPAGTVLFDAEEDKGGHPIILRAGAAAANAEGIVVRATAPATGTWRLSVEIDWAESTNYPFGVGRGAAAES